MSVLKVSTYITPHPIGLARILVIMSLSQHSKLPSFYIDDKIYKMIKKIVIRGFPVTKLSSKWT
jgi:hypothetical protein